jgi:integrase
MENQGPRGTLGKLRALLNQLLATRGRARVNGEIASHSTTASMGQALHTCFNNLYDLGYKIQDPKNLDGRHVAALCRHWHQRTLKVSTIQSRLSALRIFSGWIGKPGMVTSLQDYLPDVDKNNLRVRKVATVSKSWSEHHIDVAEKIREADEIDPIFGRMLRMCLLFGLRRMEVIQLKPYKSDETSALHVYDAKNGRQRLIRIATPEQRQVLDFIKQNMQGKAKTEHIGWKTTTRGKPASLAYSIGRYNKCMAKIGITREDAGVTGHGLRAQFAENAALIAQMIPPTLGGTGGQMPREELITKREQISELLGHIRIDITASYYGSFGRNVTQDEVDRCKINIEAALKYCHSGVVKPVLAERRTDCLQMVGELANLEIDITIGQVQVLWEIHSKRHARDWIKPILGNAAALEAAANSLVKNQTKQ